MTRRLCTRCRDEIIEVKKELPRAAAAVDWNGGGVRRRTFYGVGVAVTPSDIGSWRELLGKYLGTSIVLAGGVALYATNEFLTISLLPSAVAEIGGSRLYAWVTTLYLVGAVVAATSVNTMLLRVGARHSFLSGLAVFGVASLVCAAAPNMDVLIAGRTLQGVAGGLLAGLGYSLINAELPRWLWTRGSALISE